MVIHADIGRDLGIDPAQCAPGGIEGSTGTKGGYKCRVTYQVDKFPDVTIATTANFIEDLPVACLVGQDDFFRNFRVQFETYNHILKLEKAPKTI